MNDFERESARQMMAHQKNMKEDPDYARAYQEMQRRKKEREATAAALKRFELGSIPPHVEEKSKEKLAEDMRKEELISLFG